MSTGSASKRMSAVKRSGTRAEKSVEVALKGLRLRFERNVRGLPGSPDFLLRRWKVAVFVHGCFWHRHIGCRRSTMPKSNVDFWKEKFEMNVQRDLANARKLSDLGYRVCVIWECETRNISIIQDKIIRAIST